MNGTDKTKEFTTANRAAWEEATPSHDQQKEALLIEEFRKPGLFPALTSSRPYCAGRHDGPSSVEAIGDRT